MANPRVIKTPNFKDSKEFHASLKARGAGAKDFPNTHNEVEHLGGGKFAASISIGHRVFFDKADGNKPKKHKLTDNRPDYVLIQGAKCCTEVYPYYAKYYDTHHEEVRLHEERWVVQRLFKEPDEWQDVDAYNPQIAVEEYPEPAGDVVKVTIAYDTDYGTLTIEYFQRDGNKLKHNVCFTNTSGSTETFRVLQRWAGIVGDAVESQDEAETHKVTSKEVLLGYIFTFGNGARPFGIQENQEAMVGQKHYEIDLALVKWKSQGDCASCGACCITHKCSYYNPALPDKCDIHIDKVAQQWKVEEETFDEWLARKDKRCIGHFQALAPPELELYEGCAFSLVPQTITENTRIPNSLLRPVAVDVHPQGLKADFIFGDWSLGNEESLEIDPATATLDDPTEDGWINNDYSRFSDLDQCSFGSYWTGIDAIWSYDRRAYVQWDISSLAGATLTANPQFKYDGYIADATDEEINPITEEAPTEATNENLWGYIASGVAYVNPFNMVAAANQSVDLGATAETDLQAAMDASQSWFALGFQSPADEGGAPTTEGKLSTFWSEDKTDAANPPPTLYVEYEPPTPGPTTRYIPHCGPRKKRAEFFPTLSMGG